ncbi:lysylphosphatidylglycerol synthase transmembrane domain-containing protein [Actinotignum urinale]|uniref:lysylphosphatidylglycerol synthase transmembrane domain-containing protein n=1 Tax=Actinotignum urinale TaxID=190146 RepID=UPI0003B4CE4B|nr:lysylphosphatidylglycerol synthase transmembrane domain-containing protein [Actinotignum urinale]MDY5160610.1 lysylphosphatidylglycerol synthase transmembrane domain-containing protein [Actinotignum urinale]
MAQNLTAQPLEEASLTHTSTALLVDDIARWARRPANLLSGIISLLVVGSMILLTKYGYTTTIAVTQDVAHATEDLVHTIVFLPINVLEGMLGLFLPILLIVDMIRTYRWRALATALTALTAALSISYLGVFLLERYLPHARATIAISGSLDEQVSVGMLPYVSIIAVLLVVAGTARKSRLTNTGWWLLGIVLVISILQGVQTLPGALITVFIGTACAYFALYIIGDAPDRMLGANIITLLRRAGLDVSSAIRIDPPPETPVHAWNITTSGQLGYTDSIGIEDFRRFIDSDTPPDSDSASPIPKAALSTATAARKKPTKLGQTPKANDEKSIVVETTLLKDVDARAIIDDTLNNHTPFYSSATDRHYFVTTTTGEKHFAIVIDSDQLVLGRLSAWWQRLTLTTSTFQAAETTLETAERILLMHHVAHSHGLTPASTIHYATAQSSSIVTFADTQDIPLSDLPREEITDEILDGAWETLRRAHKVGLTHQDIRAGIIGTRTSALTDAGAGESQSANASFDSDEGATQSVVEGTTEGAVEGASNATGPTRNGATASTNVVNFVQWRHGKISSTEISRHIDMAQLLAMQAGLVGKDRAVAVALRNVGKNRLTYVAPTLQKTIMPAETLAMLNEKNALQELRNAVVAQLPASTPLESDAVQLRRFSAKTAVTIVIGVVAIFILLGSINFQELKQTLAAANPWFILPAFLAGLATYVGSAISLKAYVAEKIPTFQASLVQVAASVVGLVTPAGIGPAAINLRYLQRRNISTPVAVATVSLVQIAQFLSTVLLLLLLGLLTGDFGNLSAPSFSVIIGIILIILAIAGIFFIRPFRQFLLRLLRPTIEQVWPRLVWLGTHPSRLLLGFGGALVQTVGFVGAFGFALAAFGKTLPLVSLAVTFLVSNSVGSVVPSPGGIGPVETALTGGLVLAGIPYSVAFSVAILYRLVTFWLRVPLGWFALRYLQKKGIL